uniref:NADH-ubiquinone oxidoreductase chain 2 n=1 Tax=Melibe leonina TaxID=76178 RepID=A0A0F6QHK2_MELLB|nr:NADH dehydrogenase subunit 2 [Melibe leonina]AKE07282.1 NADH dehydrogenase subunit 2 [Melibe leonina]
MSSGNFLFLLLMLLGPIVAVSSSSWIICWVGLELSFLGLIPILISDNSKISVNKESSLKYFCVQAMGSGLLLLGGILVYMLPFAPTYLSEAIFSFSLLIKLGVAPAHFWVPSVVAGLGWFQMFLMLSWQKLTPLFFLVNLCENISWISVPMLLVGGLSAVIGALIGLNKTSISAMIGASSISHSGWVVLGCVYGSVWTYFLLYCVTFLGLILFLNLEDSFYCSIGVLSLSGLPPFIMFLGKWQVLGSALGLGYSYWYLVLPLFGSIMSLFFYLKYFYIFYMDSELVGFTKLSILGSFSVLSFLGVVFLIAV